jgi:hypothetical protein
MANVVLKSKKTKALQITLILAGLLLVIAILIIFANTEGSAARGITLLATLGLGYYLYKRKRAPQHIMIYEIINTIADLEYKQTGMYYDVTHGNVSGEMSGVDEYLVEFKREAVTFTYIVGKGVVEKTLGKTIQIRKKERNTDAISLKLADAGIARHAQLKEFGDLGLILDGGTQNE